MRLRLALAGAVVVLAGVGCVGADPSAPDGGVADRPTTGTVEPPPSVDTGTPGDTAAPDEPQGELVEPTPGMLDTRPVEWDEATVDGATVTVSWWSGVAPCNVLDRVEVIERDDEVVITLVEGTADRDAACIEIAQRKSTVVELEEPVGTRSLVDGAEPA